VGEGSERGEPPVTRTIAALGLTLMVLMGCGSFVTHDSDVSDTLERSGSVLIDNSVIDHADPWLGWEFPYRVFVNEEMTEESQAAALEAVSIINETAGAELLRVTDEESAVLLLHYGELKPGQGGYTACGLGKCQIVTNEEKFGAFRDLGFGTSMYVHEFMHSLGYFAVNGDLHDNGIMARSATGTELSGRQKAYLEYVGGVVKKLSMLP
jgi:hypothetical protein